MSIPHRFTLVPVLILAFAAGCGQKESAPAAPSGAPAQPQAASAQPVAAAEPADILHSDVAVDEPLPPFEDDSGIVLISRSMLRAEEAADIRGEVFLYEAPDGSRLLRLENLQSPKDLRLDLALARGPDAAPLALGSLKGPSGNMNYLIENGLDLARVRAIVLLDRGNGAVAASAPLVKP